MGISLLNHFPYSPTAYDRETTLLKNMRVSTSALLVLRGNITGENNSFNEKQCYSLEDYIEASLVIFQTLTN